MDAKITKTRLSNLLSYDWIKILLACVMAVFGVCMVYTMTATRAKDEQIFSVFAYTNLYEGEDGGALSSKLMGGKVFSYEILETRSEALSRGGETNELYQARMADDSRTAMFVSSLQDSNSLGFAVVSSYLYARAQEVLNFEEYLSDCERYLQRFFGESLQNSLNEQEAEACFHARNDGDKRYKNDESIARGIQNEKERLNKLKADYLAVLAAMEKGLLSHSIVTIDEELAAQTNRPQGTYNCGVFLGNLKGLSRLYYELIEREKEDGTVEKVKTSEYMSLVFFNTPTRGDKANDLRFESMSFLAYLVQNYAE